MTNYDKRFVILCSILSLIDILTIVVYFINTNICIVLAIAHIILLVLGIWYLCIYLGRITKAFYLKCIQDSDEENELIRLFQLNSYEASDTVIKKYHLGKYVNHQKKMKNKILKLYMKESSIEFIYTNIFENNTEKFKRKYAIIGFIISILYLAFGIIMYNINDKYIGLLVLSMFRFLYFNVPLISRTRILRFVIEILGS